MTSSTRAFASRAFGVLLSYAQLIKWSAMAGAIAWYLIYRLSEQAARIPEFVYVNF